MCSNSGGAQDASKQDETQFTTKYGAFLSFTTPPPFPSVNVLFFRVLKISPRFGPDSGVLVLCFPVLTEYWFAMWVVVILGL